MAVLGHDPLDQVPDAILKLVDAEDKPATYKFKAHKADRMFTEALKGGQADGKPDAEFDSKALAAGTKEEHSEHGGSPAVATEIAKDHLIKEPDYYKDEIEKAEQMQKTRPGPTFPHLGTPDNRRETERVSTHRQLSIKQLSHANALVGDTGMHPEDAKRISGIPPKPRAFRPSRPSNNGPMGASPSSTKSSAAYALSGGLLADNTPQSTHQTPMAIQLHEDNHMMFKRVSAKFGFDARKALAQNLWYHAEQTVGSGADLVNQWLEARYPSKHRGLDFEERIGTLLNLINDKSERSVLRTMPKYKQFVGSESELMETAKLMHRAITNGGRAANSVWLKPHDVFRPIYHYYVKRAAEDE
jgi:hypothetical protein